MCQTEPSPQNYANNANNAVDGNGHVAGSKKHTYSRTEVDSKRIPNLHTEISYMNQGVVDYGTRGSVRYDVVLTNSDFEPIMAWDLKTGSATLTDRRIREMRNMSGFSDLLIYGR